MATLTTIHNPFDIIGSRDTKEIQSGKPIYAVIDGFYCHFDVAVSVNGQIIHDYDRIIKSDDHISFMAIPGKGGKNIFATVAMVALAVAMPYAAGAAAGLLGGMAGAAAGSWMVGAAVGGLAYLGTYVVGGMLINAIMPKAASTNTSTDISSSTTYSWDGVTNQSQEGVALPIVYGKTIVTPPIISQYVETSGTKQYLNILYAVSGSEVHSISDIMINDNQVSYYDDIEVYTRLGTNEQTLIPSFDNTRIDTSVGVKLSTSETVRRTSYNNVSALVVTISAASGLYYANDAGGLDSRSVEFTVKIRKVGNTEWISQTTTISGASTSTIRKTVSFDSIDPGQYDISVSRTTAESTSSRTQNKIYLESFTQIIYDDFIYPNTALLAIRALATDQLNYSKPTVTCIVDRGSNTSNPAVAAQNVIELCGEQVNQTLFDEWAQFCIDQDFTCNIVFDTTTTADDALNYIGVLGRAKLVKIGSSYVPLIDREIITPVRRFLFTMGNIIKDSYIEEYLPMADRSNSIAVTYWDESLDYSRQTVTLYQSGFDEAQDDLRQAEITMYGCTNRTMAVRYARYQLKKNRYMTLTVSFEADIDTIGCTFGDIIDVAHNVLQNGTSGRVDSIITDPTHWAYSSNTYVNNTQIFSTGVKLVKIDRTVEMSEGVEYTFEARLMDDTIISVSIIPGVSVTTDMIPVPDTYEIDRFDIYAFGEAEWTTKSFRVVTITRSQDQRHKLTCIEYIPEVYNDNVDTIALPDMSKLGDVSYLKIIVDTEIATDGRTINVITLLWSGSAVSWNVYQREAYTSTWNLIGNTQNSYYQIKDVPDGTYEFKVGDKTVSQSISKSVEPLADVENLISFYQNGNLMIKWDMVTERYRAPITYEIRRGTSWENSEVLGNISLNTMSVDVEGTYWVKAYYLGGDGSEAWSANATGLLIDGATILKNVVRTWDEASTGWSGEKTNLTIDGSNLTLSTGVTTGTYEVPTDHIITLASAQLCRVSMSYSGSGGDDSINFDLISNVDLVAYVDGDVTGKWSIKPQIAISQDGIAWGDWQDYVIGDYVGLAFKARLVVNTIDDSLTVMISGFKFTVDMPDRTEKGTGVEIPAAGATITYSVPFQIIPTTQITIVDAQEGDRLVLTNETESSFDVQILNSGSGVIRSINHFHEGY